MGAEEDTRPTWGRHIEFVITCIGFAVGLGNVWRFPHLAYENGGGVFLIPYCISLVFMGIPLFCLEILFGQFASLGPITIWRINPLFKGLGYTMVSLAAIISIYYNVVVATAIYFLFASMQSTVPWSSCGNDWNTCYCREPGMNTTLQDPMVWYDSAGLNCSGITFNKTDIKGSSEEYYYNRVLEITDGIQHPGSVKWDLTLCNLLAWIIICVCLIKGVKTMGKAVYFFALFPYVLLTILLIRGVTLDGASKGIEFYLKPKTEKLKDSEVWKAAASQIFFSLSCCTGSLTAMASYNQFNNNVLRDSLIIPVINCLTSFYAGFAIFSVLGYMSESTGIDVADVTTSGPGLVFVAYPMALAEMPLPQLWSILFFSMMICLGMGTQVMCPKSDYKFLFEERFPSVETVLTALQDEFVFFRGPKRGVIFRICVCTLGFLLGIPMTTQGGFYLFDLCDIFVGLPLLLVGLLEGIAIVWVYTPWRFAEDVMLMVGRSKPTMYIFYGYYIWNWLFVTPALITAIIIFDCVQYTPIISDAYPEWAEALGWLIVAFIMIWTPAWYIIRFLVALFNGHQGGALELFIYMNQPTIKWGPADPDNRTIPRYQRYLEVQDKIPTERTEPDPLSLASIQKNPPSYSSIVNKDSEKDPGNTLFVPSESTVVTKL